MRTSSVAVEEANGQGGHLSMTTALLIGCVGVLVALYYRRISAWLHRHAGASAGGTSKTTAAAGRAAFGGLTLEKSAARSHNSSSSGDAATPHSPSATRRLRHTIQSGVQSASKLVRPFLRIETELDDGHGNDSDVFNASALSSSARGSIDPLTPRTTLQFNELRERRAIANAQIRRRLGECSAADLTASLKVNTCTWNVDQRPPPVYSVSFLTWLLGAGLASRVDAHHARHRRLVAAKTAAAATTERVDTTPTAARTNGRLPARRAPGDAATPPLSPNNAAAADVDRKLADSTAQLQSILRDFPDLLVVTLQEVDMGGIALVRESTASSAAWTEAIINILHTAAGHQLYYKRLKVVQLVGLVLIVLVQAKHVDYVSHVRMSLTRTGAMRVLGNKGSVAMRVTLYGKRFLFITAHFAAHKYNEALRMNNYHAALNDLWFDLPAFTDDESEVLRTFANAEEQSSNLQDSFVKGRSAWDRLFRVFDRPPLSFEAEARVLDRHDYIFFMGDLNSRLHAVQSDDIRRYIGDSMFDTLLIHDELRQGMVYGDIFDGFEEQRINFPPTYKFDRGTDNYDTSRKKRDPAWCDRVLFRVLDPDTEALGVAAPSTACHTVVNNNNNNYNNNSSLSYRSCAGAAEADTETSPLPCVSTSAAAAALEGGGGAWVALGDITDLGLEESLRGSRSTSSPHRSRRNADAATGGSGSTPGSGDYSSSSSHASTATPGAAPSLADGAAPTPLSPFLEAAPTAATASSERVPPNHPVWRHKLGEETFKAAKRRVDPATLDLRFPSIPNRVNALEYFSVGELRQSDHRPVCARFEVEVVTLSNALVFDILSGVNASFADGGSSSGHGSAGILTPPAEGRSAFDAA